MGLAFGDAGPQWQHRARPVQRLDPTLLIDAKHHRIGGGIQIQPHHVAQLLDEVGVGRQLELPHAVGLEAVLSPDLTNRAVAHALRFRQGATTPMGAGRRARRQGRVDDRLHLRQGQAGAPARTRGVAEHARHPLGHKPARPQPHRHPTDVQRPGHDHRRDLLRQHQHDPRPPRHLLRRRPALSHLGQLGVLGRRCVDTVPLKEHALPYQTGSAKYSVSCTAISYSGH